MTCSLGNYNYSEWEQEVITGDPVKRHDRTMLRDLYRATCEQLDSEQFDLVLLLPDDDAPIIERTAALGQWCQGFLFGLHIGGLSGGNEEVREFIADMTEMMRVGEYAVEGSEDDEASYAEIVEYIRAGVYLVKESCNIRAHPKH